MDRTSLAVLTVAGFVVGYAPASAQTARQTLTGDVVTEPDQAVFVYRDVENFIRAQELLIHESDTATFLQREYLDRASPGLLLFIEKYDLTLVHEMLHMQQLAAVGEAYFAIFSGPGQTPLATAIRDGAAIYFAELVTGGSVHKNAARDFLLANEARLWARFREEMHGNEMGDWLWSDPADPDQPRDVGYAMGARIVQAFYEKAADKGEAARVIL
jgi:hypothetical protein